MRFSLRAKIVLFSAIVLLLSHVAVFSYGLSELHRQAVEAFHGRMSASAGLRAARLDQRLEVLSNRVDAMIGAPGIAAEELPAQLLRQLPLLEKAALVDTAQADRSILALRGPERLHHRGLDETELRHWRTLKLGWTLFAGGPDQPGLGLVRVTERPDRALRLVLQLNADRLLRLPDDDPFPAGRWMLVDGTQRVLSEGDRLWSGAGTVPALRTRLRIAAPEPGAESAWLFLAELPSLGWRLGLLVEEARITETLVPQVRRLSLVLLGSLAFALTAAWFGAGRLGRRLRELDSAAEEVARGNLSAAPQSYSHDELGRLAGTLSGLSQQLRVRDQELRLVRDDLEHRVEARTAELGDSHRRLESQMAETHETEEALRQARDEAELASKAKSEFLSNMSHELRTPLNGVLGYAQILRRDQTMTDRQRENLDAIESCGQHLLTLINDVLDISKIEAGRMNVDIGPVDLHKLIKDVYDIVMQRAQSKGLALRVELDPTLPRVIRTDGTKLRQILLNLLGNAVKFTHEGWVALRAHDGSDGDLQIEVEDTGIGIPDDKIDMIFDPFKQAEAGMVIGGSGLGLAINQRLIELLGGEPLKVDTALDRGSRFSFRLPLEAVPEDQIPEQQELLYEDEANVRLAPGQEVAVLVVDDRRENRDILRRLLSDAGFTVEEADNGRVALQMMLAARFDLILMDIRMPGMSGMEAIREIRKRTETRRQKVIAVTASVFPEFREQIKAAGFDEFLGKPFRSGELFHKIREALQVRYVGLRQDQEQTARRRTDAASTDADAGWPVALARAAIKRIRSAVDLGDITALADLADKLRIDGRAPSNDIDTIARLGRSFDFDGLTEFARQLERNAR